MSKSFQEKIQVIIKKLLSKMSNFDAYYTKGLEMYSQKKYAAAVKYFETAMSKKNAEPQVYYNLGLTYQNLDKTENAKIAYTKFLEAFPSDYSGLYNLALIYYEEKDFEKAVTYFEKTLHLKVEPENVRALTKSYLHAGKQERTNALRDFVQGTEHELDCLYAMAEVFDKKFYLSTDSTFVDYALDLYLNILNKDQEHFKASLAASICYAKRGDWVNSIVYCNRALAINPNSYDANNQMGLVYYCSDNMKNSILYYEKAFKINPKTDYQIYSNLAYAYEKNGEIERAIKLFKELVSKFSNCPIKKTIQVHVRELIQNSRQ